MLGSLNMDISVTVPRLPVPGATVLGGRALYAPGGKGANQAVAAARLGARVRMAGCVGEDDFGRRLRAALRDEGVDDTSVRTVPDAPTGLAMITVDESGENMITVAPGANREVGVAEIAAVTPRKPPATETSAGTSAETPGTGGLSTPPRPHAGTGPEALSRALIISAEIPIAAVRAALAIDGPSLRILNLAPAPSSAVDLLATGVDWLVVNESEAATVLGTPVEGLAGAAKAAAGLAALGPGNVVVTAGAAGAAYLGRSPDGHAPGADGDVVTVPGFRVRAVDSVGAGDTFVGALAVVLAAGVEPADAVRAASAAGAAAATRLGTQSGMPHAADILAATGFAWPIPG